MIKNIRAVLAPLLIISYVCGLKIVQFPTDLPKLWFSLLYILFFWSAYFFLLIYTVIPHLIIINIQFVICLLLNTFITLITIVLGVYYNKKFRKCIKRIAIVDDTLEQLGTTTNYQKLRKKTIWLILGWFIIITIINCLKTLCMILQWNVNTVIAIYVPSLLNYCIYINFVDDLIIISILRYVGLKFDQINENLQKIIKNNKHRITQVGKNHVLQSRQRILLGTSNNKHIIWILIHLHLELCRISREVNSMFGLQMTLKMGLYFAFIAAGFCEIFNTILIKNHVQITVEYLILNFLWVIMHILKLFFINYICERVSVKANTTKNVINNTSYSISDIETRENILQLLLQLTQAPLRFYGLGLFQFGFKFLQGFFTSMATVLIILVQMHTNK